MVDKRCAEDGVGSVANRTSASKGTARRLLAFVVPYWWIYLGLGILILLDIGLDLLFAWFLERVTDAAVAGNAAEVWRMLGIGIGALLAIVVVRYLRAYSVSVASSWVKRDIRNALMQHVLRLPTSSFEARHSGDLVSRFSNDMNALEGAVGRTVLQLVSGPLAALAASIYLLRLNWQLAILCLLLGPLILLQGAVFGRALRTNSQRLQSLLGTVNAFLTEVFGGHVVIKAFAMERGIFHRYTRDNDDLSALEVRNGRLRAGLSAVTYALALLMFLLALGVGAVYVTNGLITVGGLIAFVNLLNRVVAPFGDLAHIWGSFQKSLAAADRVFQILDEPVELQELPVPQPAGRALEKGLTLERLTFSYDGGRNVLDGIDLHIPAGKITAIVGPSGAGKSTLFKLILGLYKPSSGSIRFDGVEIAAMAPSELRSLIAFVPQDPVLFQGTVFENIAYGRPGASREDVIRAARLANAHDFIAELPQGYYTEIGERGTRLSGGQKQRIAIARSILKDAPILLLDEATSALDSQSEAAVQSALDRLMVGRTTLVIAHRLSTVHNADFIVVLDEGKVVETGTHASLMATGGLYSELYELQFRPVAT